MKTKLMVLNDITTYQQANNIRQILGDISNNSIYEIFDILQNDYIRDDKFCIIVEDESKLALIQHKFVDYNFILPSQEEILIMIFSIFIKHQG